jgi:hypothetical protein
MIRRNAVRSRTAAVFAAVITGIGLASCSSTPSFFSMPSFSTPSFFSSPDYLKPKPTTTLLLIESNPAGAEAKTSLGQKCTTPCTLQIGSGQDYTVTFTLAGYAPQTLPVHATMNPGGWGEAPSPVFDPPSLFPTLEKTGPAVTRKPPPRPRA